MDEAWTRSMGRRLNGSMDDASAAESHAPCHSRFAGSTAIEEACGHRGEASCRAVHFCAWHEEDAYNSHASGHTLTNFNTTWMCISTYRGSGLKDNSDACDQLDEEDCAVFDKSGLCTWAEVLHVHASLNVSEIVIIGEDVKNVVGSRIGRSPHKHTHAMHA